MAEINFGILDTQAPARAAAIPQQLQEQQAQNAMRLMQIKNTVQQNALAEAKLGEYQRDLAEKDVLRKLMTRPGFDIYKPAHQAEAMGVAPNLASGVIKHAMDIRKLETETDKTRAQTTQATAEAALKQQSFLNQATRDLSANPSDENIKAWAQDAILQKIFSPERAAQIQAKLLQVPLAERQAMFASAGAPAKQPSPMEKLIALRDSLPVGSPDRRAVQARIDKDLAGNRAFNPNTGELIDLGTGMPVAPAGGQPPGAAPLVPGIAPSAAPVVTPTARSPQDMMRTPQYQALVNSGVASTPEEQLALAEAMSRDAAGKPVNIAVPRNAMAGAAPSVNAMAGAPAPANPVQARIAFQQQEQALNEPVQVIDPATGKTVYVSKKEAISRNMTPADKSFDLTPKQIQTLEAKFPQATSAVKAFESNAERLKKDLIELANHKGLSGISGLIYGRTPAVTADARKAEALYNSIVARGGFKELQDMRAASPTGGALGNVSNQENQYLRAAFAPIDRVQATPDLKKALLDAARATDESKQRIRETYDTTYEYRSRQGSAAPAAPDPLGIRQ